MIKQQTKAQARQVVTDDVLSSSDRSDLFTQALVGQTFEYMTAKLRDEEDDKSPLIIWVKKGKRLMSWFARTYFSSVIIKESDDSLGRHIQEKDEFPKTLKIVGFEATTDFYGNGFYARQIIDMGKMKDHLNDAFQTYADSKSSQDDRKVANNDVRREILRVAQDKYLNADKTAITKDAEDKFRLGRLIVEVIDNLA